MNKCHCWWFSSRLFNSFKWISVLFGILFEYLSTYLGKMHEKSKNKHGNLLEFPLPWGALLIIIIVCFFFRVAATKWRRRGPGKPCVHMTPIIIVPPYMLVSINNNGIHGMSKNERMRKNVRSMKKTWIFIGNKTQIAWQRSVNNSFILRLTVSTIHIWLTSCEYYYTCPTFSRFKFLFGKKHSKIEKAQKSRTHRENPYSVKLQIMYKSQKSLWVWSGTRWIYWV